MTRRLLRVGFTTGADGDDRAADGSGAVDVQPIVRDVPAIGGRALELMLASLRTIDDPRVFTPSEWIAMLAEMKAEIDDRLD